MGAKNSMMKYTVLIAFLFCSQIMMAQVNPSVDYPKFETVVRAFFKNYSLPEGYYFIAFQKKKDGYYVAELDDQFSPKKTHLFWSKQLGAFVRTPFKEKEEREVKGNTEEFLRISGSDKNEFDLQPYYGYPGWTLDVIKEYEKHEKLPDSMQYALGRAYMNRCMELCNRDSRSIGVPGVFDLPPGKNSMTAAKVETYIDVAKKEIAAFYKLYQQNPDFQTIVGPIYTKYCHEVMFQYLQLHIYQNEEVAKQFLMTGLYDDFTLTAARNFLNSCPPNAVLVTWGDGDTYPLIYVQAVENYRRDVLVANLSLLQLGRYIQHISEGIYDAPPLPLTLGFDFYNNPDNVVAMISKKGESKSLDELIKLLKNYPSERPDYNKYLAIPTNKYYFEILTTDSNDINQNYPWEITLDFQNSGSYILIYDLFFLDLIYSTKGQRPICYAATCQNKSMDYVKNYLALQGLIYLMKPYEIRSDIFGLTGGIDGAATEKLLFEDYEYADFKAFTSDIKVLHQYYSMAFLRLAKSQLKNGEKEKAAKTADRFFELLPIKKTKSLNSTSFIEIYKEAGQSEKIKAIWLPIVENWEQKPDVLLEEDWGYDKLFKIAEDTDNQELKHRLERIRK